MILFHHAASSKLKTNRAFGMVEDGSGNEYGDRNGMGTDVGDVSGGGDGDGDGDGNSVLAASLVGSEVARPLFDVPEREFAGGAC